MEVNKIYQGNCLEVIKSFEDNSIDCCVTSPPYWGLRDYGTGKWEGGDENCSHKRDSKFSQFTATGHANPDLVVGDAIYKSICPKCGAVRIDEQLGLEETPEEYVENMVQLFREVKRILKPTGTLWLNLGDSYMGGGRDLGKSLENASSLNGNAYKNGMRCVPPTKKIEGYKSKDLVGIPWMVAFALRKDGWYLRQDIIWQKPNPMPESVTDRCTKSHEYIFLLSKSPKYYYDNESIKEPSIDKESYEGRRKRTGGKRENEYADIFLKQNFSKVPEGQTYEMKNKRSVWNVTLKGFKEAHFATYPEELIEPMIKAGCPEKVCSKCGKPLEIKIIKEPIPEDCKTYLEGEIGDMVQSGSMIGWVTNNKYNEFIKTRKIEKQEIKCDCNEPFAKGIVLDPFMGAGTTAVVAKKLKRNWIGIDLNPEYIKIAEKRIKNTIFTNPIF